MRACQKLPAPSCVHATEDDAPVVYTVCTMRLRSLHAFLFNLLCAFTRRAESIFTSMHAEGASVSHNVFVFATCVDVCIVLVVTSAFASRICARAHQSVIPGTHRTS